MGDFNLYINNLNKSKNLYHSYCGRDFFMHKKIPIKVVAVAILSDIESHVTAKFIKTFLVKLSL